MSFEIWIAFAVTSAVLLASPGPTIMIVVSYALGHGKSSAWATVPGVAVGDLLAMSISLAGAGAILAASATLFTILKLAGAAYLIWLGVQLWRSNPKTTELQKVGKNANTQRMFYNSFMVTALNPKSIVFFIAFVP
ncbi:MAG: LysE family translocator, partial [Hyphomicrobiales bacterium]